ncbi:MAG: major capsid protein [Mesorhizobium sp.]
MVDTPTKLEDVIVPERFNPYFREMTTRVNAFFQSGILAPVDDLAFGDKGGAQIQMPFWKALGERAQLLDDSDDLEIRKIDAGQDVAVLHARALVYGATDLSGDLAGDDPMSAIGAGVGENWSYEYNMVAIATLRGAMGALAAESASVNTLDISGLSGAAAYVDGHAFIDAGQKMGDRKDRIAGVSMHSAVEAWLAKNDLIEEIRDSQGNWLFNTFQGKRVITDDEAHKPTAGVYDTWLFGPGALGYGEGSPKKPSAVGRDELKGGGQEFIVTRRHFVIHPRGIKWNPQSGVPAKTTPSDAELATAANWQRVWEPKNIRIVRLRHKIG